MKCSVGFCCLPILVAAGLGWASPSLADGAASENAAFDQKVRDKVLPFLAAGELGALEGEGGVSLATFRSTGSGDVVVLLEGFAESYRLYGEVMSDLSALGYEIATFDLRGQGLSGRMTADSEVGHVETLGHYVRDFERYMAALAPTVNGKRFLLLAHSTGGLIAAHYLAAHPDVFSRAALSAPYFRLNSGWLPEWFVLLTTRTLSWWGWGDRFAPGQGGWTVAGATYEENKLTHSRERFAAWLGALRAEPAIVIRGASNAWTAATVQATQELPDLVGKIKTPVLLLQAGADAFVVNDGHDELCAAMPKCRILKYPTSFHELLQETDDVRSEVLRQVDAHFRAAD